MEDNKSVDNKLFLVVFTCALLLLLVVLKTFYIQYFADEPYKEEANRRNIRDRDIIAKRGSIYSDNGSLLSVSTELYDIHFDAVTVKSSLFNREVDALSDSLALLFDKPAEHYHKLLIRARQDKERYLLIGKDLTLDSYKRIKGFPIFKYGPYRGGFIFETNKYRKLPLGPVASVTIGKDRKLADETYQGFGIEHYLGNYLRGVDGKQKEQHIYGKLWKPLYQEEGLTPKEGYDIFTTIDLNMQDVVHQALIEALSVFEANHGSVVIMDIQTGEIKAISNLGLDKNGAYTETKNYAVWEQFEPGSLFKLPVLASLLDDLDVSISEQVETGNGKFRVYNDYIRDTKNGGYGKITLSDAFVVSSNIGIAKSIMKYYNDNPKRLLDKLTRMNLNKKVGIAFEKEVNSRLPNLEGKDWSGLSLPWMSFGYGLSFTPIQILSFYNAIANDGKWVSPYLVKYVKNNNQIVKDFSTESKSQRIINPKTAKTVKKLLARVVSDPLGTGYKYIKSDIVPIAGKTGTTQKNYSSKNSKRAYISSFVGFFPADKPQYSCSVIIHEPDTKKGYYGAKVAGSTFKKIAENLYHKASKVELIDYKNATYKIPEKDYDVYYTVMEKHFNKVPNVKGMVLMDAVALLENLGIKVTINGKGDKVSKQSILPGSTIKKKTKVILDLI